MAFIKLHHLWGYTSVLVWGKEEVAVWVIKRHHEGLPSAPKALFILQECRLLPQCSRHPAEGLSLLIRLVLNVLISFQGLSFKQITFLRIYNKILSGLWTVCLLMLEEF